MCGENFAICFCDGLPVESPPRMRGKLPPFVLLFLGGRITPAHAGKTSKSALTGCSPPDHPRACGENSDASRTPTTTNGSPPRMRGKLLEDRRHKGKRRITPAHAGKTLRGRNSPQHRPDHPRACGENCRSSSTPLRRRGSPPRMRGKLGLNLSTNSS